MVLDVRSGLSQDGLVGLCATEMQRWLRSCKGNQQKSIKSETIEGQCVGKELILGEGHEVL